MHKVIDGIVYQKAQTVRNCVTITETWRRIGVVSWRKNGKEIEEFVLLDPIAEAAE